MATVRLLPPASGPNSHTVNGRTYVAAIGSTLDVPDFDASVLQANGWTAVAGTVGATAARPLNPPKGTQFHDTTLNKVITWDGKAWRDPASGVAV